MFLQRMIVSGRAILTAAISVATIALFTATAGATVYNVNTNLDTSGAGTCSLRDAINAANGKPASGSSCTQAATGNDRIKINFSGTIYLGSSLPDVSDSNLTILDTLPTGITIDGRDKYQVMVVEKRARLRLRNLTIAHGYSTTNGGGIVNNGTLIIIKGTIADNTVNGSSGHGAGIDNEGTLKVIKSTFSGNAANGTNGYGGGIDNEGSLKVIKSTFSGNSVGAGGSGAGIFNHGPLKVIKNTFSDNSAPFGAGIENYGSTSTLTVIDSTFSGNSADAGGGIENYGGGLTVIDSTFADNTANTTGGGAVYNANGGTLTITASTIDGNNADTGNGAIGGGIYNGNGTLSIKSTILAASTGNNCSGTITDAGYNISSDNSCGFTAKGSLNNTDPELDNQDGLENNGGPTETIALENLTNSPAINAIPLRHCTNQSLSPSLITTDQRGVPRFDRGERRCDIGAYEFSDHAAHYTVNTSLDTSGADTCSLRDAINAANDHPTPGSSCTKPGGGNDTIEIDFSGTIQLNSTLPPIADNHLTIVDTAPGGITINGRFLYQVMAVDAGAGLTIRNLTIEYGNTGSNGGGIFNKGTLTVIKSTLSSNQAQFGGGIYNGGTLKVIKSTFPNNYADAAGGGIYNKGTLTVTDSTFYYNIELLGGEGGGGIYNNGTLAVTASTFLYNTAQSFMTTSGEGGGIYNDGTLAIKSTILAGSENGNCYQSGGTLTDNDYNISEDNSCGFTARGSLNGTDPKLDPNNLQNNGGPTETIALVKGSPAIDAIPLKYCTDQSSTPRRIRRDQRGAPRPDGSERRCDIGAYEFQDR